MIRSVQETALYSMVSILGTEGLEGQRTGKLPIPSLRRRWTIALCITIMLGSRYEEGEEGEEDGSPEEEGEEEAADGPEDSAKRDHGEEDLSAEEHLDVAAYPLGVGLSCGGAPGSLCFLG